MSTDTPIDAREGSLMHQLVNMEVGETIAFAQNQGEAEGLFDEWVQTTKRRLGNRVSPRLTALEKRYPKRSYTLESGVCITTQNRAYVLVLVTRLADIA